MRGRKRSRVVRRKRAKPRSRKTAPRGQAALTLGNLVARGVRSLISMVPLVGPTLAKGADFLFTELGLSSQNVTRSGNTENLAFVQFTAAIGGFAVTPADLLISSRIGVRGKPTSSDGLDAQEYFSDYSSARVLEFTVSVKPINPTANRSGTVCLAIQPFTSQAERDQYIRNPWQSKYPPDVETMRLMKYSIIGSQSQELRLTYKTQISDGLAYAPMALDDTMAAVLIRYDDPSYSDFDRIKPERFGVNTLLTGRVLLVAGEPGAPPKSGPVKIDYRCQRLYSPAVAWVNTPAGGAWFSSLGTCEYDASSRSCSTKGVTRLTNVSSEEGMDMGFETLSVAGPSSGV